MTETELERIRAAYRERDAATHTPYRWDNPGYVTYMQELERAILRAFADGGVPLEGIRALDVGCGSGYFLDRLRVYGAGECHGIDLMENRIAEGRKMYPSLHLHVGSATELPFDDGEFGLVTQFTCLSSILDAEVRSAVAQEMRRVAMGGWVLSLDMRGILPQSLKRAGPTPTVVGLDRHELVRLFGEPDLLRRTALAFDLSQRTSGSAVLRAALAAIPLLRSHLLGLWRIPGATSS